MNKIKESSDPIRNNVGTKVKKFYNTSPFPDFDLKRFNSKNDLLKSASIFAKKLDESIPKNKSIIDVGTGTGQLAALLSLNRKCVFGIDFSDTSLTKARALKNKLSLHSLTLKKINILDTKQIDSINIKFDYLLCFGVLHQTRDAYVGFQNILSLLKPGGYLAIGLYNTYGRIPLKIRKFLTRSVFKNNSSMKKYFIELQTGKICYENSLKSWWLDQYVHPHESTYTIGEVLKWFKKNNIEYHSTLLPITKYDKQNMMEKLWKDNYESRIPSIFEIYYAQLKWILKTHKEGGYWITFGKKKNY